MMSMFFLKPHLILFVIIPIIRLCLPMHSSVLTSFALFYKRPAPSTCTESPLIAPISFRTNKASSTVDMDFITSKSRSTATVYLLVVEEELTAAALYVAHTTGSKQRRHLVPCKIPCHHREGKGSALWCT